MKLGLVTGSFDLLDEGHTHLLREARKHCNYLIAAVIDKENSVWNLERRVRVLTSNPSVSAAVPFNGDTCALIQVLRPDVVIRGADQVCEATHSGVLYITIPDLRRPA